MKQTGVAKWLKGTTIAIAVMGLVFFSIVMPVLWRESLAVYPELGFLFFPGIVFGCMTAVFCYAVLYQFWKVCVQMEQDNTFSMENANAFKQMSRILIVLAELWGVGFLVLLVRRWLNFELGMKMAVVIFIWLVIAVLATALSLLVQKAYELKRENELTI